MYFIYRLSVPLLAAVGLALGVCLGACGEIPMDADMVDMDPIIATDAAPLSNARFDAGDTDTALPNAVCEALPRCTETAAGLFECPSEGPEQGSCKAITPCGDVPRCTTDETACLTACGRVDCAVLDRNPETVQCPDNKPES